MWALGSFMITVFEGNISEDCVRYKHHSLVLFYLDQSQRNSEVAVKKHNEGKLQSNSIVAIVFSAMCIEAFINETAESTFENEQLSDFFFLKGNFKKRGKSSSVVKKLEILFSHLFNVDIPKNIRQSVSELIELRNNLVHYKLSETAAKIIYPPMQQTEMPNGETMTTIDFMQQPKTVSPPLIQRITGESAKNSYNTACSVLEFWNTQINLKNEQL